MKVLFFIICLLLFLTTAHSQDSLTVDLVKKYTYTFTLENNRVQGPGWDSLSKEIRQSQFVILGENHSSPLLSLLMVKVLEEASKAGYKHFLLETGPVAAAKVHTLYSPDSLLFAHRMNEFLSTYKLEMGAPPSEFIVMKNDIPMLQSAIRNKFTIMGLDKEYFSSIKYLVAELKQYCNTPALQTAYAAAMKKVEQYGKENNEASDKYPYITKCKTDPAINALLSQVESKNSAARFIAQEMRKTFTIYGLYEAKEYYESEEVRIANIKKNFGDYYYKHSAGNIPFKAVIKIGNVHSPKGLSYLQHYDIGNLVSELANMNGTKSLHIYDMRRFRKNEKGEVMDFYNNGYEVYPNIITQTDSTRWTIIDLRPLRKLMMNGKLKVASRDERDLISKNDLVLLTPIDDAYQSAHNYQ